MVQLAIDAGVCIGAGQCEMVEPESFIVDDHTVIARLVGPSELPKSRAEHVVERCPSGAISIVRNA
ncbi:MAG: ferredoxin [Acidimicrobiales bacterium]|nr:ferredoxin [Acidimicrobiales bacterium]